MPLVELSVFTGLVLLVWGVLRIDDDGGRVLLVCGMALASLGGLDTALREHFFGYRSHAVLIAALPAVLVAGVLFSPARPGSRSRSPRSPCSRPGSFSCGVRSAAAARHTRT